jgi:hypothetical protein
VHKRRDRLFVCHRIVARALVSRVKCARIKGRVPKCLFVFFFVVLRF